MGRRKNNYDDLLELILKLGGVAIVLALLSPGVRNLISALGTIVMVLLILTVLVLVGILVYKFIKHKRTGSASPFTFQDFSNSPSSSSIPVIPPIEPPDPEVYTTAKLIEKLRTIDWYQFEKLVALIYEHQGYLVTRRGGANPDGGIDLPTM